MNITVNGESHEFPAGTSIQGLLDTLSLDANAMVVQRNEDIIEKADYAAVTLDDGDRIELIQFVGGG